MVLISYLDPRKAEYVSSFWKYVGIDVVIDDNGNGVGRSKRKEHLIDVEYINKSGEKCTKKSVTFNPLVRSKLLGVLASCFIKNK